MSNAQDPLIQFFLSDEPSDEAMLYEEMTGFLTSLVIVSGELNEQDILQEIFDTTSVALPLQQAVNQLRCDIQKQLLNEKFPQFLSSEHAADETGEMVERWAYGFMQGVFINEQSWFKDDEQTVADLTLPILSCSGLMDDELPELDKNDDLFDQMAQSIPDAVIDLYLLFQSPEK